MSAVLAMHKLRVSRNGADQVLDIQELTLRQGELMALVGPNGAGKSTLLQTMNLLHDYKGDFSLFGIRPDKSNATDLRRRCSLVFQEALLLDGSVAENVGWPLRFRRLSSTAIKNKVDQALVDFGCEHLAGRSAKHLSGGEAQRVCIARALATNPELLLLDEPFAALDVAIRSNLIEEIRLVAQRRGITVVLVSHSFPEVLDFAERAVVLAAGRVCQDGPPQMLMRRPQEFSVAQLVGMDNILECKIESGLTVRLAGDLTFDLNEATPTGARYCCLPGDSLFLFDPTKEENRTKAGAVIVDGFVQRITPGIGCWRVAVNRKGVLFTSRLPREQVEQKLQVGSSVRLGFDPAEVQIVD